LATSASSVSPYATLGAVTQRGVVVMDEDRAASPVSVRAERPDDGEAIRAVVDEAFAPDATVGPLVEAIRASPRFVPPLSLVAVLDGRVVGHVMLSHVDVVDDLGDHHEVLSLSPLSVSVPLQRQGIGGLLVTTALAAADLAREPLVVLEGHPTYYPRFGFEPASSVDIEIHLPSWAPPEAAMVRRLAAYDPEIRGLLVYPPAFDGVVEA
jgi:putative acetyltransferase